MHLQACFAAAILALAPAFRQQRTRRHAELLLIGAILAPGKRTVTSLLQITGLSRERRFTTYHRVLNRAIWDAHAAARLLLGLLIAAFAPSTLPMASRPPLRRPWGCNAFGTGSSAPPSMVEPDAPGPDPLGGAQMGVAVSVRARSLGALRPRAAGDPRS